MASKLPPATPRPRTHARTASLDSGGRLPIPKLGNGNYGEVTQKLMLERRPVRTKSVERRTLACGRGTEAQDPSKVKEQLALIEGSKSSLMQDLARAKRNVEELSTKLNGVNGSCRKDKVAEIEAESMTFLDKEGWHIELDALKQQYELALLELQTSKQAMESLKHELMVCVEAKDEAVRLAGEAMNAAEATARRVEVLSAELLTTKGSAFAEHCAISETDDLIEELPGACQSLLDIGMPLEIGAPEKTFKSAVEITQAKELTEPLHCARANIFDYTVASAQGKDFHETQNGDLASSFKDLQSEMVAAQKTEQKLTNSVLAMQANLQRAQLEAEKAKSAEAAAQALLVKVARELEEAEEKLLRATAKEATLLASLDSLKADLQRSQKDIIEARDSETKANCKSAELNDQMNIMREESQAELMLCKKREASAHATIQSLQMELEKCKADLIMMTEKEMAAAVRVAEMVEEMKTGRSELIEQQKYSTNQVAAVKVKLEESEAKLVTLEEREFCSANKIATLMVDLEKKQSEVGDLQNRLLEMESKAEETSIELFTLQEKVLNLAEVEGREAEAAAKVAALNVEALGLRKDLEEALNVGQFAREGLSSLEVTLQQAISDRDVARLELETAHCQMELSRKKHEEALVQCQASKDSAERALEVMRMANNAATEELLIASKLAKEVAQVAREEARMAEEKLQAVMKHAELARVDMEKMRKETQSARDDVEVQKAALAAEKERARVTEEEVKAMRDEMVKVREDLAKSLADVSEANGAWGDSESRLRASKEELEAEKTRAVSWEQHASDQSKTELARLREKLRACEEQLQVSASEVETLQMNKEELLCLLEIVKAEREGNKRAVSEAHQNLADLEKAKRLMEADIQRLLDDSKLWKTPKDIRDILVLSEVNGSNGQGLIMDSREEKPQPESPSRESLQALSTADLAMDGEDRSKAEVFIESIKEEVLTEKEEETGALREETHSRVVKKKKHALLHRLHSYLDKKKSTNTL